MLKETEILWMFPFELKQSPVELDQFLVVWARIGVSSDELLVKVGRIPSVSLFKDILELLSDVRLLELDQVGQSLAKQVLWNVIHSLSESR